jgi:hypothetical protein
MAGQTGPQPDEGTAVTTPGTTSDPHHWLVDGGEMSERVRAFDWSATPLGPADA